MGSTAFVNAASVPLRSRTTAALTSRNPPPRMSLRTAATRLAAAPATLLVVAPALATEGTGEGLGIDNPLLYLPLVLIPGLFLALFLQFDGSQDKEDFLGTYDQRRK